ncbi:cytochrome P450 [Nocardia sp. NPDC050435]|uniref:cytochrome P450 family protein n=1 Tax=Nocardia sp. NPDC050435 TaxID=3155040 RepID=UPI0033E52C3A
MAWLITREADVRLALDDPRLSIDRQSSTTGYTGFALPPALDANMLNKDAPDHTRLRRLASGAFTRRRVDHLRPRIHDEADRLLDKLAGHTPVDLIESFAAPLPLAVIGDLLGIPVSERPHFRTWTNTLLDPDPSQPQQAKDAVENMESFLQELVRHKRSHPTDDLLSDLIRFHEAGDALDSDELVSLAFLILWAGYQNTTNLIGNATVALFEHPGQLDSVRKNPQLSDGAVEELLRYAHSNQFAIRRFATEPLVVDGIEIPRGDTVLLGLASSNRDPRWATDPEVMDLTNKQGQAHLAFGHGPHYCLGAPLARVEIRIAMTSLFDHFPDLQLATSVPELRWRRSFREHGLQALPVIPGLQRPLAGGIEQHSESAGIRASTVVRPGSPR